MTGHLHFPHFTIECFGHGKIHPEYPITHNKRVSLSDKAPHIRAVVIFNRCVLQKLPSHNHKYLRLIDPEQAGKLPDNDCCDHKIE